VLRRFQTEPLAGNPDEGAIHAENFEPQKGDNASPSTFCYPFN